MTERTPWWFSGDEAEFASDSDSVESNDQGADSDPDDGEEAASSAMDWLTLVSGAKRMVDWATETVMAPHAEHEDPRAYPQCVVCRTLVVLGDVGLRSEAAQEQAPEPASDESSAPVIEWIPIREAAEASRS